MSEDIRQPEPGETPEVEGEGEGLDWEPHVSTEDLLRMRRRLTGDPKAKERTDAKEKERLERLQREVKEKQRGRSARQIWRGISGRRSPNDKD